MYQKNHQFLFVKLINCWNALCTPVFKPILFQMVKLACNEYFILFS